MKNMKLRPLAICKVCFVFHANCSIEFLKEFGEGKGEILAYLSCNAHQSLICKLSEDDQWKSMESFCLVPCNNMLRNFLRDKSGTHGIWVREFWQERLRG